MFIDIIKAILRPLYNRATRVFCRQKSREDLHEYWKQPWDGANLPEVYATQEKRSRFLLKLISRYAASDMSILEIGCNVGRNLNALFRAGFDKLEAIEISEKAVEMLKSTYPDMALHATIHNAPVEEVIKDVDTASFDTVFTMAVLEHIHKDSEWVFIEMARIVGRYLITIEDEKVQSWRHFPRNYGKIFVPLGLEEIEKFKCSTEDGLSGNFVARVFKKPQG